MASISEYIKKKCDRMTYFANILDSNKKNIEVMNSYYSELVRESVDLTNEIKYRAIAEGCEFGIDKGLAEIVKVNVEYASKYNITHIAFNKLLPMRTKGYTLNERDIIRRMYLAPLNNSMLDGRVVPYKTKVAMCFFHTFAEDSVMIDHDNFEAKPIKDAISSILFKDDSPKYVSEHWDFRTGLESRTDIYIVPEEYFITFWQNISVLNDVSSLEKCLSI